MSKLLLNFEDLRQAGILVSRVQLWRNIRAGKFPRPVKLAGDPNSTARNFWLADEVAAFIEGLRSQRDAA